MGVGSGEGEGDGTGFEGVVEGDSVEAINTIKV